MKKKMTLIIPLIIAIAIVGCEIEQWRHCLQRRQNKRRELPVFNGSSGNSGARGGNYSSAETIQQTSGNVKGSFSISSAKDKRYMDAVNAGDMQTAQEMVDEAAEAAMTESKVRLDKDGDFWYREGDLAKVYHSTYDDFTVFDRGKLGFYADDNASDKLFAATAHIGFYFNTQKLSDMMDYVPEEREPVYETEESPFTDADYMRWEREADQATETRRLKELEAYEKAAAMLDSLHS